MLATMNDKHATKEYFGLLADLARCASLYVWFSAKMYYDINSLRPSDAYMRHYSNIILHKLLNTFH